MKWEPKQAKSFPRPPYFFDLVSSQCWRKLIMLGDKVIAILTTFHALSFPALPFLLPLSASCSLIHGSILPCPQPRSETYEKPFFYSPLEGLVSWVIWAAMTLWTEAFESHRVCCGCFLSGLGCRQLRAAPSPLSKASQITQQPLGKFCNAIILKKWFCHLTWATGQRKTGCVSSWAPLWIKA